MRIVKCGIGPAVVLNNLIRQWCHEYYYQVVVQTDSGTQHITAGLRPSSAMIDMNITAGFCSESTVMCIYHCRVRHPAVIDHSITVSMDSSLVVMEASDPSNDYQIWRSVGLLKMT